MNDEDNYLSIGWIIWDITRNEPYRYRTKVYSSKKWAQRYCYDGVEPREAFVYYVEKQG